MDAHRLHYPYQALRHASFTAVVPFVVPEGIPFGVTNPVAVMVAVQGMQMGVTNTVAVMVAVQGMRMGVTNTVAVMVAVQGMLRVTIALTITGIVVDMV